MIKANNEKEVEVLINRALQYEKCMGRVGPSDAKSILSPLISIPDWERSIEDIREDLEKRHEILQGDSELHYDCTIRWLPSLDAVDRRIVIMRLNKPLNKPYGAGWKKIANVLHEKGLLARVYDRRQLQRYYKDAIHRIFTRFF